MKNKLPGAFVDMDVIIRLLTSDDLKKQEAAASLFEKVQKNQLILRATDLAIADCVFVLSSPRLYSVSHDQIRDMLSALLRLPYFKVENKQALIDTLDIYASSVIDFSDIFTAVAARQSKVKTVYSYDHDYDKIPGIVRRSRNKNLRSLQF